MKIHHYGRWTRIQIVIPNARYEVQDAFWEKGWLEDKNILDKYVTSPHETIEIDYFDNGERPSIGWSGLPK